MLPTTTFFTDVERVIAETSEANRGQLQLLVDELERVANHVPRVADRCYRDQARLYAKMGKFDRALAAVERALAVVPEDGTLLVLRGDIHQQAQAYTEAAQDYAHVVEDAPEAVTAHIKLAEVHQATGHPAEALDELNIALKYEPRSLRILYQRGLILCKLSRAQEAVPDFQAVASLSPDDELRRAARQRLRELGVR